MDQDEAKFSTLIRNRETEQTTNNQGEYTPKNNSVEGINDTKEMLTNLDGKKQGRIQQKKRGMVTFYE